MSEAVVDDIVAVLPPLLQSLEALSYVARHLNPPDFGRVMQAVGAPERALQAARSRLGRWPDNFADVRGAIGLHHADREGVADVVARARRRVVTVAAALADHHDRVR